MANMCVLTLPLVCEPYMVDYLNTTMEVARKLYNMVLDKQYRVYKEMVKTKSWRERELKIREELQRSEGKKSQTLKLLYDEKNMVIRENGFGSFSITHLIHELNCYPERLSSNVASTTFGNPINAAFQKLLFGNGDKVHFKRYGELNSIASNGKSGISLIKKENMYYVRFSNRKTKRKVFIPVRMDIINDYEKELLDKPLKIVRIVRKRIKGKDTFSVQLTFESRPPIKYHRDGTLAHPRGMGKVGIAIWRNTVCAVSKNGVLIESLNPWVEEQEEKVVELSRQLTKLRQLNNPDNYNEDGTVKKGIVKDGKRARLVWHDSIRYVEIKKQLNEVHRFYTEKRKLHQNFIMNELIKLGDEFVLPKYSFLTKKGVYDPENPESNDEYKKKKERRKSIQLGSPAMLVTKLNQKQISAGFAEIQKVDIAENLYWYRHDVTGNQKYGSVAEIAGTTMLQTAYRAYLISCFNVDEGQYDQQQCVENFDEFVKLYNMVRN